MNVLIVDDQAIHRKLLRSILEAEAMTVHEAVDGLAALSQLEAHPVDAIISDILMPRMDGYRFCHEVRSHPRFGRLPFLFYTSTYTSPSDEKLSLELGAQKFLRKPAPAAVILESLREAVSAPIALQSKPLQAESTVMQEYNERLVAKLEEKNLALELQTTALETAANAVVITDPDGKILWVNPAFTLLTGYTLAEVAGKTPRILKSGKQNREFYDHLWATIKAGKTWRGEFTNRRKDGTFYEGEQTITPVLSPNDTITHFIGIMTDITAQKRVQDELQSTHEKLRRLLEHSPAVLYTLRIEGERITPIVVSENIHRLLDVGVGESASYEWWIESLHPEDRERVVAMLARGLEEGGYTMEYRIRHHDGTYRWVEDSNRVLYDPQGKPMEAVGVWMDITTRKKLEQQVSLREHQLDSFFAGASAGLAIVDADLRFVQINQTLAAINGLPREQHLGRKLSELLPDISRVVTPLLEQVRETKKPILNVELSGKSARDASRPLHWTASYFPILGEGSRVEGLGAIVVETTEQKLAEERIQEQARLLDLAQDAIVVHDLEERIHFWNQSAERLFGWTSGEAIGKSVRELLKIDPAVFSGARSAMLSGGEWSGEIQQTSKDNRKILVHSRWSLVCDARSEPQSVLVVNTDITEKKELESQYLRAQRMESIGRLASGVAHDLNNILAPILMSAPLLRMDLSPTELEQTVAQIEASAHRGGQVVKQLLSLGRGAEGQRGTMQLGHLIREMTKMVKQTFARNIVLEQKIGRDLWTINADVTQMHQVLLNLCVNASDAMPEGGRLTLQAQNLVLEPGATRNPEARPGPYLLVQVSDSGTGIPPEILDQIFDPFFTTKAHGKGTGLGLAIVQGIVRSHGGFIELETAPGKGTTFKIYLPATPDKTAPVSAIGFEKLRRGHGELVLIVDDESAFRDTARQILLNASYQVVTARDGVEGISVLFKEHENIKVVLSDLMMPGLDGVAMTRVFRRIDSALPIISSSGLAEDVSQSERIAELKELGVKTFLTKPYTAATLLTAVDDALHE